MGQKDQWIHPVRRRMLAAMVDSRGTLRYAVDLPARLRVGETELSARIANLSLGGVFIVGPPLPIGTRAWLRFKAPGADAFVITCITRWTTAEGCGLAFAHLQPMDTYQLARIIGSAARATGRVPRLVLGG